MVKLIHTGDWHISIPESNEEFYIKRFQDVIHAIYMEDAESIVIAGDIFHKTPTVLEVSLFIWALYILQDSTIYIIPGNHDSGTKKYKAQRYKYLSAIFSYFKPPNVIYTDDILEHDQFLLVSNDYIRLKKEIPVNKDKILISHIRHELKFGEKTKKAEYDLTKLLDFKLVLLSDIHTTVNYFDNIWYSTSPYRTHIKTIKDVKEIDDSIFGYNVIDLETLEVLHKELRLPNVYKMIVSSDYTFSTDYPGIINIVYEVTLDTVNRKKGGQIVYKRNFESIELQENLYDMISEILKQDYNIKEPEIYMMRLLELVGDI